MADKKIKEPTYKDLSKIYTDEEIVESFVLRSEMTEEERKIAHQEFLKFHFEHIKNMSESEIILGNLMRMKIQIEDYINNDVYDEKFSFGNQLKEYISIIKRSQKEFAEEIDVHTTKLNRIVNNRDNPNIDLFFRIEKHSDGILSARNLHRLHSMKLESDMVKNVEKKRIQYGKVKNKLSFGKTG